MILIKILAIIDIMSFLLAILCIWISTMDYLEYLAERNDFFAIEIIKYIKEKHYDINPNDPREYGAKTRLLAVISLGICLVTSIALVII